MIVSTYNMKAPNGNHIRKATMVTLSDGREILFTELMSKREAIRQAENRLPLENLNFTRGVHAAMLQVARLDKPSGDYPEWVSEVEILLNDAAREHMANARNNMGILRAESAVR